MNNNDMNIEIAINNKNKMIISQSEADKIRDGIKVERFCGDELIDHQLISTAEFVMLINYYNYIKDNDIKQDFINPNGYNYEEYYEDDKEKYYEPEM